MISDKYIKILRKNELSLDTLVERVTETDELGQTLYLIYVANLDRNNSNKYIFEVDAYEYDFIQELHEYLVLHLQRIYKPDRIPWVKDITNSRSGFVDVRDVLKYDLSNFVLPAHVEAFNAIFYGAVEEDKTNDDNGAIEMKTVKAKQLMNDNTDAAKAAAAITAGKTLNAVVLEKVKPQLPMVIRGYADSPVANIVVANLVNFGVNSFASDNDKARWVADAMMVAAMSEFLESFNVEQLIKEVVDTANVSIPEVKAV